VLLSVVQQWRSRSPCELLPELRRVARIGSVAAAAVVHSAPRSGPLTTPIPATPNSAPSPSLPLRRYASSRWCRLRPEVPDPLWSGTRPPACRPGAPPDRLTHRAVMSPSWPQRPQMGVQRHRRAGGNTRSMTSSPESAVRGPQGPRPLAGAQAVQALHMTLTGSPKRWSDNPCHAGVPERQRAILVDPAPAGAPRSMLDLDLSTRHGDPHARRDWNRPHHHLHHRAPFLPSIHGAYRRRQLPGYGTPRCSHHSPTAPTRIPVRLTISRPPSGGETAALQSCRIRQQS
jgi:hypothetical protein